MTPLRRDASDADLLAYVDRWAALLEAEDYEAAFALTDHDPIAGWAPELLREVIKGYAEASTSQKVTLEGQPTDVRQRKEVTRWPVPRPAGIGQIWYDLNIDGRATDLTATFWIVATPDGLVLRLADIHVM
ncbi:MAG TPA: hypothetical protein VNA89_04295 [Gemmatimonadaceae bacterium]|nr:hypothetical protein [Gemmatimonadaceae bacterium]